MLLHAGCRAAEVMGHGRDAGASSELPHLSWVVRLGPAERLAAMSATDSCHRVTSRLVPAGSGALLDALTLHVGKLREHRKAEVADIARDMA